MFSIESINQHAWMNRSVPVHEAAHRQALYSEYVEEEVVLHIRRAVGKDQARIAVAGASFSVRSTRRISFLRRPELFDTLIAMSGFYDLEPDYGHGFMNDDLLSTTR